MKIKKSSRSGIVLRWVGTLLTTGLFIGLVAGQKWELVLQKASGISPWAVLLAVAFFVFAYGFNTLRWCTLLWTQDVKITFWQAFRITWAGSFASNFLPSTIGGDGLRVVSIFRYTDHKTLGVGSVALDRIINMAAMACLIPLAFWIFGPAFMPFLYPGIPRKDAGGVTQALAVSAPFLWLQKQFGQYFPKLVVAFKAWASHPWAFVYAFLVAWPSNLFPMAASYLIAHQLGMDVSFWQVIGAQTVVYFVSVLPISFNGYGLREAAYTTLYTALGGSLEQASTLALVTRLITVVATIPGVLWLSTSVTDAALQDADINHDAQPGQL